MHPIPHAAMPEPPSASAPTPMPALAPVRPEPAGPPQVSASDPVVQALARDCKATPWLLPADAGAKMSPEEAADLADMLERYRCQDAPSPEANGDASACLKARDACRKDCRSSCLECGKSCPAPCETCAAACPATDAGACRLACGVAAAQCQKTCLRAREPCYDKCLDAFDACTRKADDDWARECTGCTAVLECCSQKTSNDHSVSCPEECWKGKVPALCGQCDWFRE
jgi:hypothetical protein